MPNRDGTQMRVALRPADTKLQAWFAKSFVVILGTGLKSNTDLAPGAQLSIKRNHPGLPQRWSFLLFSSSVNGGGKVDHMGGSIVGLRRVLPTRLTSYFEFRGRICQETLYDRSSVAFDLRQCALRPGFAGPVPASSSGAARGRANARILPWQTSIATLPTFPRSGPVSCSHCRPTSV